jgi:hypothetical protein
MGVTMMGGLLTWLFVVQALLIGALFLGVNYYLWQSMGRIRGGERYQPYYQYLLVALMGCLFIWLTPHTLLMTGSEVKAMGGAQHPVIGNYGVMSSKNGAVVRAWRRAYRMVIHLWILLAGQHTSGIVRSPSGDDAYRGHCRTPAQSKDAARSHPSRSG